MYRRVTALALQGKQQAVGNIDWLKEGSYCTENRLKGVSDHTFEKLNSTMQRKKKNITSCPAPTGHVGICLLQTICETNNVKHKQRNFHLITCFPLQ